MKEELKKKITYGSWGLILGAAIVFAYGFGLDGWTTGQTAQKTITEAVSAAKISNEAAICIAQFMQSPSSKEKIIELQEMEQTGRTELIQKGGWDKMPGQKEASSGVAQACSYGLEDFMKK